MLKFNKHREYKFANIYQYKNGSFLPSSSQPDPENGNEITADVYSPHKSTRYKNVVIGQNGKAQINDQGLMKDTTLDLPELYKCREDCCGCFACFSICPKKAIEMCPDEEGFLYPVVDAEKCIRCYKCLSICIFESDTSIG